MQPLEPPDNHHLAAAEGWLELGDPREAATEWNRLAPGARHHPAALELRWQILARLEHWPQAVLAADELVALEPESPAGWLHRAYALRRSPAGGLQQAWEALHPAADLFPEEPIVAYNLACYATQLGQLDDGWEWFLRALQIAPDTRAVRRMALADEDLKPLWDRIREQG